MLKKSSFYLNSARGFSTNGPVHTSILEKLRSQFVPEHIEVVDESHKHAGHAAMKGLNKTETHFTVVIVSSKFEGMPLIARHRLVNDLLSD
jgi:BolA protein